MTATPDQISSLCARLGIVEPLYYDLVEKLKSLSCKPHETQVAYKLTKEDYENFGLPPSPNL